MSYLCLCLSIKTGCFIGATIFIIMAIIKIILLIILHVVKEAEALIVVNIVLLLLAGVVLYLGVLMMDRVSIMLFLTFNCFAMMIEIFGFLILCALGDWKQIPLTLILVAVIEKVPFIYMIPVGIVEYRIVTKYHLEVTEAYIAAEVHRGGQFPHSTRVPAMGF